MIRVWNFYYKDNNGFTLFELLLVIFILGIIITSVLASFIFLNKIVYINKNKDKNIGELNRCMEYISHEINRASDIIYLEEINGYKSFVKKYPENLGFLIKMNESKGYLYITYCLEGSNLRRMAYRTIQPNINTLDNLGGYNLLSTCIYSIGNTQYDEELSYIELVIQMDKKSGYLRFSQRINII